MTDRPLTLGAVLYEGFELLDMFGPLEMFTALPPELLQVVMVAESKGPVRAGSMANSPMPTCMADYGFDDAPELDLIGEVANISMLFASKHGERLGRELGIDPTAVEFDMDGVKKSMGLDSSVNSLTYKELQERRTLIQKRKQDHVESVR